MKKKRILAWMLSISMSFAPIVTAAEAENSEASVETAVTEAASWEAQQQELPSSEEAPEETAPETAPSISGQTEQETAASNASEQEALSSQTEEPSGQETTEGERSDGQTEPADGGKKETAGKTKNKTAAANAAAASLNTEKASDQEDFLKIISAIAYRMEGEILVELTVQNAEYDTLYFGGRKDAEKSPVFTGEKNEKGGYTFTFAISPDLVGKTVLYVPGKEGQEWYDDHDLYLKLPGEVLDEKPNSEAEDGKEEKGSEESPADAEEAQPEAEAQTEDPALFLEEAGEMQPYEEALFLGGGDNSSSDIDNSTTLADGTYTPESFTFAGGTQKAKFDCTQVMVSGGKATAVFTTNSSNMTHVYMGYAPSNEDTAQLYDPATDTCGKDVYPISGKTVTVPVKLNVEMDFAGRTIAMSDPHWVRYTYKITLDEPSGSDPEETDPTETEPTQTEPAQTEPAQTEPAQTEPAKTDDPKETEKIDSGKLKDGKYKFDFGKNENAVELAEGYKMFKVIACTLTVKNGKMTAVITLNGEGYDYLYPGTKEEALKAKKKDWIPFVKDKNGKYTYKIPVEALDEVVIIAGRSKKYAAEGAAQPWYDKGLIFHSSALVNPDGSKIEDFNSNTKDDDKGNSGNSNTGNHNTGNNGTGNSGKNNGGYSANTNGSTGAVDSFTGLADGDYTPDSFSWSGGTGKLSISCAKITVSGGKTYATIVFSSGKIVYVKAGGGQFNPLSQTADTTTFEIPVQLNANNKILACTTAMSQPHEVEYTLYIGLEIAKSAALGDASGISKSSAGGSAGTAQNGAQLEKLEDAPKIVGLDYEGTAKNEYAKYFRLHYYQDDFRVLEISLQPQGEPDWSAEPEEEEGQTSDEAAADSNVAGELADAEEGSAAEQRSLYDGTVLRYLIVPEGAELPAGIDKQMLLIQLPVEKVYVDSDTALKMLDKLERTEQISAVGMSGQECSSDSVVRAMADGKIESIGHYDETAVYKALVTSGAKLAIVPSDLSETSGQSRIQDVGDGMSLLKIPMVVDRAEDEQEQLAKYEWLKVYGAIFDCEKDAGEAYQAAADAVTKKN